MARGNQRPPGRWSAIATIVVVGCQPSAAHPTTDVETPAATAADAAEPMSPSSPSSPKIVLRLPLQRLAWRSAAPEQRWEPSNGPLIEADVYHGMGRRLDLEYVHSKGWRIRPAGPPNGWSEGFDERFVISRLSQRIETFDTLVMRTAKGGAGTLGDELAEFCTLHGKQLIGFHGLSLVNGREPYWVWYAVPKPAAGFP